MIDINLIRNNPELVKENIKKKFQNNKLELVDKVQDLDRQLRAVKKELDELRNKRNTLSSQIGLLMRQGNKEEAEKIKIEASNNNEKVAKLEEKESALSSEVKEIMYKIPNIISDDVPIGKDDSENVERERFLEPKEFDFEVPYHVDILEKVNGIDIDSARRTSGQGFYYLTGNIARLHSAILAYARDL